LAECGYHGHDEAELEDAEPSVLFYDCLPQDHDSALLTSDAYFLDGVAVATSFAKGGAAA
jgi:hypothetical protein